MLVIISPAKTLDFDTPPIAKTASKPAMLKDSSELVDIMRNYSPDGLMDLMGVRIRRRSCCCQTRSGDFQLGRVGHQIAEIGQAGGGDHRIAAVAVEVAESEALAVGVT